MVPPESLCWSGFAEGVKRVSSKRGQMRTTTTSMVRRGSTVRVRQRASIPASNWAIESLVGSTRWYPTGTYLHPDLSAL